MNDLERVTKQAFGMIVYMGMSEKLPNLCYYTNDEYSFSKPYSERTAEIIDEEVKAMVNQQYERAKKILSEYKDKHKELAELLSAAGLAMGEPKGISWGPARGLHLSDDKALNFIVTAVRKG